jgi:hypothetical protein
MVVMTMLAVSAGFWRFFVFYGKAFFNGGAWSRASQF